jgi:hypothetical protein
MPLSFILPHAYSALREIGQRASNRRGAIQPKWVNLSPIMLDAALAILV